MARNHIGPKIARGTYDDVVRPEPKALTPADAEVAASDAARESDESSSAQRRTRIVAEAGLFAIIAGFLITVIPGVRSSPGYSVWLDGVWQSGAFIAAALISSLRLRKGSPHRAFWRCAVVALYCEAAGHTIWFWLVGEQGDADLASVADIAWSAAYVLFLVGLVILVRQQINQTGPSVVVDAVIVALATAAVGATVLESYIAWQSGGLIANLINVGYPIMDLAFAVGILAVLTIFRFRPPPGIWHLAVALTLWGIADLLFATQVADDAYVAGGFIDALFVIACTVVAFGVGRPVRKARTHIPGRLAVIMPAAAASGAVVVLFVQDSVQVSQLAKWLALATIAAAGARVAIGYFEALRAADHGRLAHTDDLTGLLNRRGFFREHARMFRSGPVPHAVFVLDFDRFKFINDSLGHHFGDDLLRAVAERISKALTGDTVIARFGGDEFAVAVPTGSREEAELLAAALFTALTEPFDLAGLAVEVGVSVGIAMCPEHGTETATLLRHADSAMFQSKRGGLPPAFFAAGSPDRENLGTGRSAIELLAEFRAATHARALDVHYQPIRDVVAGQVVGAEALLRWTHPVHGMLGPALLIPLAVRHGMMSQLTRAVLDIAVAQAAGWRAAGYRVSVSVNVSPLMLEQDDLCDAVDEALTAAGLPPSALVVEITEDTFIRDYASTREILGALRTQGVRISLDDFGQGHSILEYLKELTIDEMKLDRAFIHQLATDNRTAAIVKAIITLAHDLGVSVVAEGVETEGAARWLVEHGADLAQGNFYCEPLSSADIRKYFDEHRLDGGVRLG